MGFLCYAPQKCLSGSERMEMGRKKSVFILTALVVLAIGIMILGNTFATGLKLEGAALEGISDFKVSFQYFDQEQGGYLPVRLITAAQDTAQQDNPITKGMFWCPGRTEIIYLQVQNNEAFPVRATVSVNVTGSGFGKTLTYAVIEGEKHKDHPTTWESYLEEARASGKTGILEAGSGQGKAYTLLQKGMGIGEKPTIIALAIHMAEDASNMYQNNTMNLEFSLRIDADYKSEEQPASL